ncbi:MAG: penicillin-binding protein 2 [Actinomycetota bacterium]|nr:penicillin-binding protein 2 [Actinomycetota bacterium]
MKLTDTTLDKNAKPDDVRPRLVVLTFIAIGLFLVLISRLWFMQVMAGEKYMEMAQGNYIRSIPVEAPRGIIYDRNGQVLVDNRPSIGVSISPAVAEKTPELLEKMSEVLRMSVDEIKERLAEKKSDPLKPRIVKRDVDDKTLAYIEEHKTALPGVDIVTESIRGYPHGELGAHLFGYLGEISDEEMTKFKQTGDYLLGDIIGKTGVENMYEGLLRGQKGSQQLEVNASGRPLSVIRDEDPVPGHNLMLSVDLKLQKAAEQALKDAMNRARSGPGERFTADAGAAIVLDPRNGEILAIASNPTYNPELFIGGISKKNWNELMAKKNNYPLNNRALMAYPPGSTFKPVTMIGALEDGLVAVDDTFNCTGKWYGLGKKWAKACWNHAGHGGIGVLRGMAESCDTVFYVMGQNFHKDGQERLQYWARELGFGARTGVDLATEARGRVPDKEWKREFNKSNPEYQRWYPGDTVNMAIGQGDVLATPLQLATFYGAIANGGMVYRPHIGKAMISWDGNVKREFKPKTEDKKRLPVSKETIAYTQASLEKVTERGTGTGAFNGFPVKVAGKTGTSEVRGKDDFAWFVCYAPVDEPKFVVVVLVEQGGHGGSTAAPAARKILAAAFGLNDQGAGYVYDPSR